jgi:hypothetical protein
MRKSLFFIGLMIAMTLCFTGCITDYDIVCVEDYTGDLAETEEKMLEEWKLSAIVSNKEIDLTDDREENPTKDIYAQYSDCQRDAVYSFNSNRTFKFEQGMNAVDCDRESVSDGTWQLQGEILRLVSSCNLRSIELDFNQPASAFSFSNDFNIRDAEGLTIEAELTFTYTAIAP